VRVSVEMIAGLGAVLSSCVWAGVWLVCRLRALKVISDNAKIFRGEDGKLLSPKYVDAVVRLSELCAEVASSLPMALAPRARKHHSNLRPRNKQ
jgi:hypothetical protein